MNLCFASHIRACETKLILRPMTNLNIVTYPERDFRVKVSFFSLIAFSFIFLTVVYNNNFIFGEQNADLRDLNTLYIHTYIVRTFIRHYVYRLVLSVIAGNLFANFELYLVRFLLCNIEKFTIRLFFIRRDCEASRRTVY